MEQSSKHTSEISKHRLIAIDLEGVELYHGGEICALQAALPYHRVFLILTAA
jgi:hypothetical protein